MKRCILYSLSGLVTLSAYSQHTSNGNVPPNILLIVVDDMGFSDIQPFGGEIPPQTVRERHFETYHSRQSHYRDFT